jgi:hypothetical protein
MKIAICYYGLSSGKNTENFDVEFTKSFATMRTIMNDYDYDIFIHSVSNNTDAQQEIITLMRPKKYKFEDKIIYNENPPSNIKKYNIAKGRWHSQKKVIELKTSYEKENNFVYDFVFMTRFDCSYFSKFNFENLDKNKFYAGGWLVNTQQNIDVVGIDDLWFICGSKNMDIFSMLYDNFDNYIDINNLINSTKPVSSHIMSITHIRQSKLDLCLIKNHRTDYNITRRLS